MGYLRDNSCLQQSTGEIRPGTLVVLKVIRVSSYGNIRADLFLYEIVNYLCKLGLQTKPQLGQILELASDGSNPEVQTAAFQFYITHSQSYPFGPEVMTHYQFIPAVDVDRTPVMGSWAEV